MEKKRKYLETYIKFGFTTVINNGRENPQCVLCNAVLSSESMKPSKLKRHLETKHAEHSKKDLSFFQRHEAGLKRQRLEPTGKCQQQNTATLQASYEVALQISKNKKPHTIGEKLIKPCLLKVVKLVLGDVSEEKIRNISLSNNTIQRRIEDMSLDVRDQVLAEIKNSPLFSLQLDESTDVSSCAQLLVFVRYLHEGDIKEEFLFCSPLETTTKGEDIMKQMNSFFEAGGLEWKKVCGVCTDGAPAMLGCRSGFQTKVKELAPQAKSVHCFIHRYALASKTLPASLIVVLETVIKVVNYIKSGALNTRLFRELCKDMNSDHEVLLFYTSVRWLSKGNVINRVFELREEIKLFLEVQEKTELAAYFAQEAWIKKLAYLSDIFDQLNKLNLKLQGRETNIMLFQDCLTAFVAKLNNWQRKVNRGNIAMFENLSGVIQESEADLHEIQHDITAHLESLENEFRRYFPELTEEESLPVRNPFSSALNVASLPDDVQDEFLELRSDSSARDQFKEKTLNEFWCGMHQTYANVAALALRVLLPYASTYLCESGFSTLLHIKSKSRNRLNPENDMRLSLSTTQPRIVNLVARIQAQPSH